MYSKYTQRSYDLRPNIKNKIEEVEKKERLALVDVYCVYISFNYMQIFCKVYALNLRSCHIFQEIRKYLINIFGKIQFENDETEIFFRWETRVFFYLFIENEIFRF